ncbi:MAG: response regulator [Deltaproteobacteria bacterium]
MAGLNNRGNEETQTAEILLVESVAHDRASVEQTCREAFTSWQITSVETLAEAITALVDRRFELVLLGLELPDSSGLDTFARLHTCAPQVPVLVLVSSPRDEALGRDAVERGAQDYVPKAPLDASLLSRAIRYALERARLQRELEQTRERERRDEEIAGIEELSRDPGTAVTAQLYAAGRLRDTAPEAFERAIEDYARILEMALEHRVHKETTEYHGAVLELSDRLGFVRSSPRDVIEIHTLAVRSLIANCTAARATAYVEEARLVLLELMGDLVSFYRTRVTRTMGVGS